MSGFGLDDLFWATVVLIFVVTLAAALVRRLRRDRCLRLMHDFHVTVLTPGRTALWGDMMVFSNGAHLVFDSALAGAGGDAKTGALLYQDEIAQAVAVCRTVWGLTTEELAERQRQIRRSIDPPLWRRTGRAVGNFLNLVRDAVVNTLSLLAGRVTGRSPWATAVKGQTGRITELGGSLVDVVANAYEPLLERLIGKPVVLELHLPDGAPVAVMEFAGYLVDYNATFVAVFNPQHEETDAFTIEARESTEQQGCRVALSPDTVSISPAGADPLVVRRLVMGTVTADLGVALLPGHQLRLRRRGAAPVQVEGFRSPRLDLVCPRARARVRYSGGAPASRRAGWSGTAPETMTAQEDS